MPPMGAPFPGQGNTPQGGRPDLFRRARAPASDPRMSATNVQNHAQSLHQRYASDPDQAFKRPCELVAELARTVKHLEQKVGALETGRR